VCVCHLGLNILYRVYNTPCSITFIFISDLFKDKLTVAQNTVLKDRVTHY
jgi:hypothetical protein